MLKHSSPLSSGLRKSIKANALKALNSNAETANERTNERGMNEFETMGMTVGGGIVGLEGNGEERRARSGSFEEMTSSPPSSRIQPSFLPSKSPSSPTLDALSLPEFRKSEVKVKNKSASGVSSSDQDNTTTSPGKKTKLKDKKNSKETRKNSNVVHLNPAYQLHRRQLSTGNSSLTTNATSITTENLKSKSSQANSPLSPSPTPTLTLQSSSLDPEAISVSSEGMKLAVKKKKTDKYDTVKPSKERRVVPSILNSNEETITVEKFDLAVPPPSAPQTTSREEEMEETQKKKKSNVLSSLKNLMQGKKKEKKEDKKDKKEK